MKFIMMTFLSIISFNITAFEYLGLTSGMTEEEVLKVPGWSNKKGRFEPDYEVIFNGNKPVDLASVRLGYTPGKKRLYNISIIVSIGSRFGKTSNFTRIEALKQILIELELKYGMDGEIDEYNDKTYSSTYGTVEMPRLRANITDIDLFEEDYNEYLNKLVSELSPPYFN